MTSQIAWLTDVATDLSYRKDQRAARVGSRACWSAATVLCWLSGGHVPEPELDGTFFCSRCLKSIPEAGKR